MIFRLYLFFRVCLSPSNCSLSPVWDFFTLLPTLSFFLLANISPCVLPQNPYSKTIVGVRFVRLGVAAGKIDVHKDRLESRKEFRSSKKNVGACTEGIR